MHTEYISSAPAPGWEVPENSDGPWSHSEGEALAPVAPVAPVVPGLQDLSTLEEITLK